MDYEEFARALWDGVKAEASGDRHSQAAVFPIADRILPNVDERWVYDAVAGYEAQDWVEARHYKGDPRGSGGGIIVTVTAQGRRTP